MGLFLRVTSRCLQSWIQGSRAREVPGDAANQKGLSTRGVSLHSYTSKHLEVCLQEYRAFQASLVHEIIPGIMLRKKSLSWAS